MGGAMGKGLAGIGNSRGAGGSPRTDPLRAGSTSKMSAPQTAQKRVCRDP